MKECYNVNSDRYNHVHHFVKKFDKDDEYLFIPAEDWMPIYVTMNENKKSQQKKENLIDIKQINEEFSNDDVLGTYERKKNTSALIYSKQRDNTFS